MSNGDSFEHKFLNKTKIYQHAGKCDNQQKIHDILEAAMVSIREEITDDRHILHTTKKTVKKPLKR